MKNTNTNTNTNTNETVSNETINNTIEALKVRDNEATTMQAQELTLDIVKAKINEVNATLNDIKTKRIVIAYLISIITRQSKSNRFYPAIKPAQIKNTCNNLFNTNYTTQEIEEILLTNKAFKFLVKNGFFNGLLLEDFKQYDPQIVRQENQKQLAKQLNAI